MKKGQKKAVKQVDGKRDWLETLEKLAVILLTVMELTQFILEHIK